MRFCDSINAYIIVKGKIIVEGTNNNSKRNERVTFKNNAAFRSCISKINNTLTDNAEDLDIVMLMYNLLECGNNYSMTSGSLWNYYRDEVNNDVIVNNAANFRMNNSKITISRSFKYKTKIKGSLPADNNTLDTEVVILLKYLSNFCRSLVSPLIKELDLRWTT